MQVEITLFSEKWQGGFIRAGEFIMINMVVCILCMQQCFFRCYELKGFTLCMGLCIFSNDLLLCLLLLPKNLFDGYSVIL